MTPIFKKGSGGNQVGLFRDSINDILTDGSGNSLSLTVAPAYQSTTLGSLPGTLKIGEIQSYTAYYTITQAAADTGSVVNSAIVSATGPGNTGSVSDTSDNGNDTDGNTTDDATVVEMTTTATSTQPFPQLEVTKTALVNDNNGSGSNDLGDKIVYTITIKNIGNVNLSGLTISDTLTDGDGDSLVLTTSPTFVSATANSTSATIVVNGILTYTAEFIIEDRKSVV